MTQRIFYIIELSIYGFLNFFPYLFLVILPFKDQFRFSKKTTYITIALLTIYEIYSEYLSINNSDFTIYYTIFNTALYVICLLILLKANLGKLLFTLFMITNYANLIVVASTFVSNVVFHQNTDYVGHYTTSISMFVIQVISFLIIEHDYINHYIPTVKLDFPQIWNYLWLVPLVFYISWTYVIYFSANSSYTVALQLRTNLFLLFTTLGSWLIYHIIIKLINAEEDLLLKNNEIHMLEIQSVQYETLTKLMEQAKIARHDLRHHITLIDNYITNNNYTQLHEYLKKYKKSLSNETTISYCENSSVNLIINYFSEQSQLCDISFDVLANIPQSIPLPDTIFNVLLGNILENALNNCSENNNIQKKINLVANFSNNVLAISLSNTFSKSCSEQKNQDCRHGLGLISVKNIVKTYNGSIETEITDSIFTIRITLLFNNK